MSARNWIQTCDANANAFAFPLLDPKPSDYRLADIGHALSRINRYTGHIIPEHYSVAEHSVRVAVYLRELVKRERGVSEGDPILQVAFRLGLMHDASEAYLNDISSPLKSTEEMAGYRTLEGKHEALLSTRFGLDYEAVRQGGFDMLREADLSVLDSERPVILGKPPKPWEPLGQLAPVNYRIYPGLNVFGWRPNVARLCFLSLAERAGLR